MANAANAVLEAQLKELGKLPDDELPILRTLLLLGALERDGLDIKPYEYHLQALHDALTLEVARYQPVDGDPVVNYRLARLNAVLLGEFNYSEDNELFGAIDTINMLTVIDRRKGIPVALGALYMELAGKQGWPIYGLNFPGHFLIRLDHGSQRLIVDPYHRGVAVDAGGMRRLLKETNGSDAELNHSFYDTVSPRAVVLRFYNNKKTRLITEARYEEALKVAYRMLWIAPEESRLYFDIGILSMKQGLIRNALEYLEKFIDLSTDKRSIAEAKAMIANLQVRLQ